MSKGSHPRPSFVSGDHYRSEHDRIFSRGKGLPDAERSLLDMQTEYYHHTALVGFHPNVPRLGIFCACGKEDCPNAAHMKRGTW